MKVFINYRREDSAGHAGRLYDSLAARFGHENVFMDLSGIGSGQSFTDVIDAAIVSCDALLAVIGDGWLTCSSGGGRRLDDPADFVRAEIAAALERRIPVIPVLVEGTAMPPAGALPDGLKPLAGRNAHELSDGRWSYDVGRLVEAIERLAPGAASSRGPALAGEWTAEVAYEWGHSYTERFTFKVDGSEVLGTASFLGVRRGIFGGSLTGDRVKFHTRTQVVSGDWKNPTDVTHHYRGRISGDEIAFSMQSEGGNANLPIEFTARRVAQGTPAP